MVISPRHKGSQVNAVLKKPSTIAVAAALGLGVVLNITQTLAVDVSHRDFPFLIYCQYQGTDHAYYFSQLGEDGRAIYLTPDRQAGIITIDGVAERVGGERPGSCMDKTLSELRSSGQAFDLPH